MKTETDRYRLVYCGLYIRADWWFVVRMVKLTKPSSSFFSDDRLPQIYYAFNRMRIDTGAFDQLTRKYMEGTFNPNTPDVEDVRLVFSYGVGWMNVAANMLKLLLVRSDD